jgi:hypothetical protein
MIVQQGVGSKFAETTQVIAGTAGIPPAMSAKRETIWGVTSEDCAPSARLRPGRLMVPTNHLSGCEAGPLSS